MVMPSDPEEQISLFFSYLFQILKKASASPCVVRVARVMEMDAAQVEQALAELLDAQSPCVAVYPKKSEVIVRICDNSADRSKAAQRCTAALQAVTERLGDCVYGIDVNSIEQEEYPPCLCGVRFGGACGQALWQRRQGGQAGSLHLQLPPRGDGPGKAGDQR